MFGFKKNEIKNEEERKQRELGLDKINPKKRKAKKLNIGKTIAIAATIFILAVAAIIAIVLINSKNNKLNKENQVYDPELARAMTYDQFEPGDDDIEGTDNVKFSAFFLRDLDGDGYAEKIKGTCKEIGKQDTLFLEINVLTGGKLTNGTVNINGENFQLVTYIPKDNEVKKSYISNNTKTIELNDITNGTHKMLVGLVRSGDYNSSFDLYSALGNDINNYSRINTVKFTGTYIDEYENEIEISKEINLTVDWYGTVWGEFYNKAEEYYDLPSRINEENSTLDLSFTINPIETKRELLIKSNYIEGIIPDLNGFSPVEVSCNTLGVNFNYDESTKKFTIKKDSGLDDGKITNRVDTTEKISKRHCSYDLTIAYPLEAYDSLGGSNIVLNIPVKTKWEGFNNPNSEFANPIESNYASTTLNVSFLNPKGDLANINVVVGERTRTTDSSAYRYIVSKRKPLRIYNQISEHEINDTFPVKWEIYTGTRDEYESLTLEEQSESVFIKNDATTKSMDDLLTNVGIGFYNIEQFLEDDGWIKVYDSDTDNLLVTFTKDGKNGTIQWDNYTEATPYYYSTPVKHIKVETSKVISESNLSIFHTKELDDEYIVDNYTKEEFDSLEYIQSDLKATFGNSLTMEDLHQAKYEKHGEPS